MVKLFSSVPEPTDDIKQGLTVFPNSMWLKPNIYILKSCYVAS